MTLIVRVRGLQYLKTLLADTPVVGERPTPTPPVVFAGMCANEWLMSTVVIKLGSHGLKPSTGVSSRRQLNECHESGCPMTTHPFTRMCSNEQGTFNGMALWQPQVLVFAEQLAEIHDSGEIPTILVQFAGMLG